MGNGKKKITVTVPQEKEAELEKLKESAFKEKSASEMFRCLLREGLSVSAGRRSFPSNPESQADRQKLVHEQK